jgi:hypothetical protein
MPIVLPFDLTIQEMRVLQEFKRLNAESLPLATIKAIKHPSGGGEAPAAGLVGKGYLTADGGSESETFALTQKGRDFIAIQAVPESESPVSEDDTPVE